MIGIESINFQCGTEDSRKKKNLNSIRIPSFHSFQLTIPNKWYCLHVHSIEFKHVEDIEIYWRQRKKWQVKVNVSIWIFTLQEEWNFSTSLCNIYIKSIYYFVKIKSFHDYICLFYIKILHLALKFRHFIELLSNNVYYFLCFLRNE